MQTQLVALISSLWQRRFWEHQIRDQEDFNRHLDYIHYNPVKHGLCERPDLWPCSTLQRYIKEEKYPGDWAVDYSNFEEGAHPTRLAD